MRPKTIVHNAVSVDGSISGFGVDMEIHYRVAGFFRAEATLVGSATARSGIAMSGDTRAESDSDMARPVDKGLAPWVMVDSGAELIGSLHSFRNSDFGGDPIILVSETTPRRYLDYLVSREYRHHIVGEDRVDLDRALELIEAEHGVETLLVDSGPGLNGALLNQGLVDHLSLIVAPVVVGAMGLHLFSSVEVPLNLKLVRQEVVERGATWVGYDVIEV